MYVIKTTVKEFIKYLKENDLATTRLMTALNSIEYYDYYIEDISRQEFENISGVGENTTKKFFQLRAEYLEKQYAKSGYGEMTREELIKRIKDLEYILHREKNRIKLIIEGAENELRSTIENIKRSVEWHEGKSMRMRRSKRQ